MGSDRPIRSWLRRWLGNPIASVILLSILATDAATSPRGFQPTTVGRLVRDMSGWIPPAVDPPVFEFYAVRTEGTLRVIDPQHTSWDRLASILSENEDFVAWCIPYHIRRRQGFWSHVYETEHRGVAIQPLTKEWSEADLIAVREFLFSDQFQDSSSGYWVSSFRDVAAQDRVTRRILWLGVAHDAFALLLFTALLYSFTGWPAWFAARPWSRRNRRLLRGLCPECGYDTRGLTTCPECGTPSEPRA